MWRQLAKKDLHLSESLFFCNLRQKQFCKEPSVQCCVYPSCESQLIKILEEEARLKDKYVSDRRLPSADSVSDEVVIEGN